MVQGRGTAKYADSARLVCFLNLGGGLYFAVDVLRDMMMIMNFRQLLGLYHFFPYSKAVPCPEGTCLLTE